MAKEKKYAENGWLLCDFDGDDGDCDTCGKLCNPTYYRRTSFECDEGEYSCAECIEVELIEVRNYDEWIKSNWTNDPG